MKPIFVDRIDITEDLISKVERRDNSLVVILHSKTGVGKTALTRNVFHILKDKYKNSIFVSVSTNPINESAQNINNGYAIEVFEKLSRLLMNNTFSDKNLSFSKFASSCKNKIVKKHLLEFINERFIQSGLMKANILCDTIDILFQKIFQIGIFDEENILDEIEKNMAVVNDYIKFVLKNASIIIHIENIQNIDWTSEKYLQEWIQESKIQKNVFFLEYTEHQCENKLSSFIDRLTTTGSDIFPVRLKQLDTDNVIEIAYGKLQQYDDETEQFISHITSHYETQSNGNIFELENYILTYDKESLNDEMNSVARNLMMLNKNQKFVMSILILHEGKINTETLIEILKKTEEFFIAMQYNDFIESIDLILNNGNEYYLKHSSIIDVWKNLPTLLRDTTYLLAFRECRDYYLDIYKKGMFFSISKSETVCYLLNMYSEFSPCELIDFLDEIDELSIIALSKEQVWTYLNKLFESIKNVPTYENHIYHIIRICLQCELFEEAGYIVKLISEYNIDRKKYILYQCLVLSLREMPNKVYQITENNIGKYGDEIDQYLYLFQISALRSMNETKKLNELIGFLREENKFNRTYTKGYFLRLAEVYEKRNDAEGYIKDSIKTFESINEEEQIAKSRISLSYILAIQGKYQAAIEQSDLAEEILSSSIRNRCIFFVNKAALLLLSKEPNDTIWDLLENAELLTQMHFNRCAIFINKLIYCIEVNDFEIGNYCANLLIKELQNAQDLHLIAIASYDLYVFFNKVKNFVQAEKYYNIAYEYRKHCNTLNARFNSSTANDGTTPLIDYPWHVCFLSYWDVDIKFG